MSVWVNVAFWVVVAVLLVAVPVGVSNARARRRARARTAKEQFRREFTAAVLPGLPPASPAAPSVTVTTSSTDPKAVAAAVASIMSRSSFPTSPPRPTVVRSKNDESYFAGRGNTHEIVYGMRNFKVDRLFRLTAYIYPSWVWKPGENVARCLRKPDSPFATVAAPGFPADHPMIGCLHGFYAYYDGSRDYHEKGDVTGIIKGWGEAEVGDKGFRVMRAQIVAIKFSGGMETETKRRVMRNYPDVAVFDTVEDMLREFPTSAGGLEYLPEADDDFWTREA